MVDGGWLMRDGGERGVKKMVKMYVYTKNIRNFVGKNGML